MTPADRALADVAQHGAAFMAAHDAFIAIPLPPPDPAAHRLAAVRMKETGDRFRAALARLEAVR